MIALQAGSFGYELWATRNAIVSGISVTCLLAAGGMLLGLAIGAVLSVAAAYGPRSIGWAVSAYVLLLRGVPLLVTLLFVFFGLSVAWKALPAEGAALLAMGLFAGAYLTEIFRGALLSIPIQQHDAAKAIGLPFLSRLAFIALPLALRRALPSMTNIAIDMVKASTLVAALGVSDLLQTGQQIAMRSLLIPEFYFAMWGWYLAINLGLSALGRWCEGRFRHVSF
jgi:polar amino acid transport system permease protein